MTKEENDLVSLDPFLQKVQNIVLDHMHEENFGIRMICEKLQVSRTKLHNDIKNNKQKKTTEYINLMRFKRAKELLLNEKLSIKTVAYKVGFKDPGYFSRLFKKAFGETPSGWREREKEGN